MLIRKAIAAAALTLLVVLVSLGASAQLAISGAWGDNRGGLIDIPLRGGITLCTSGFGGAACPNVTLVGNALPVQPVQGGVPARPPVSAAELIPASKNVVAATLTVPPNIFTQPRPTGFVPVPSSPNVVQLNTSFAWHGPLLEASITDATPAVPPGDTALLLHTHTLSFAAQPNRPATGMTVTLDGTAPNNVQLSYTHGANRFGGSMQGMLMGSGSLILVSTQFPPGTGAVQPLADSTAGATVQAGATWRRNFTGFQPAGNIHSTIMIVNPCAGGLFSKSCSTVTGLGAPIAPLSTATSQGYGFPFTTGTVMLNRTGTVGGGPATSSLSAMGGDTITSGGNRQIQLIAAHISKRTDVPSGTSGLDNMTGVVITLPEPKAGAMLAGALAVVAVLFSVRKRF